MINHYTFLSTAAAAVKIAELFQALRMDEKGDW